MMNSKLAELADLYSIQTDDLKPWFDLEIFQRKTWLNKQLISVYKPAYKTNERVVFTLSRSDIYDSTDEVAGQLIKDLHQQLTAVDISNYFVVLFTSAFPIFFNSS